MSFPCDASLRPKGESVGVGFVVTFVTVLVLAAFAMLIDNAAELGLRHGQPWTALVLWGLALVPGVWFGRAWRRRDARLRTLRRWLRVPERRCP
jgi:hypothetical protein